jgi:hypothetical protein
LGQIRLSDDATSNVNITGDPNVIINGLLRGADGCNGIFNFTMTGGYFQAQGLSFGDDGGGTCSITGGTVILGSDGIRMAARSGEGGCSTKYVQFTLDGGAYVEMTGGFGCPAEDYGSGDVYLNSGTLICNSFDSDGFNWSLDIDEGVLWKIKGDRIAQIQNLITNTGQITGKDGTEDPSVVFDGEYTRVGFNLIQESATKPNPSHNTSGICPENGIELTWTAGEKAQRHEVFFGTSFADVNSMTTPTADRTLGNESYDTGWLEYGKGYYWRIDEVNDTDACTWPGAVWHFSTENGRASDPSPFDGKRGIQPGPVILTWELPCYLTGQTLYYGTDFPESIVLFEDDFEDGFDPGWSSTGWSIYDATDDSNYAPHDNNLAQAVAGTLTSGDIDTSDANAINVSFVIRLAKGVGTGSVTLNYYNGSTYVPVADWNSPGPYGGMYITGDPYDAWIGYSDTITDSQFLDISNFRIQLVSTLVGPNSVSINNVKVTNTWPVNPAWVEANLGAGDNDYPVPELLSQSESYGWRLDTIAGGTVIQGQYWRFTVGFGGRLMYYKFDGSGAFPSPITDDSGNNIQFTKDLSEGGTITYGDPDPNVNPGGASAEFDPCAGLYRNDTGEDDMLRLTGSEYTIEMWVKPEAWNNGDDVQFYMISKLNSWGLYIHGDNDNEFRFQGGGGDTGNDSVDPDGGEWYHIAVVFDQADEDLSGMYLNGEREDGSGGLLPADNNNPIWIGVRQIADGSFEHHFNGLIDEIRVHDIAVGPCGLLTEYRDPEYPLCPYPVKNAQDIDPCGVILSWIAGESAASHVVYFSTEETEVQNLTAPTYVYTYPMSDSFVLDYGTTYYWRVVEQPGNYQGEVWKFTTEYVVDDASLRLHYKLDEISGGTAYDSSGYGNHGDVDNEDDAGWNPEGGQFGGAFGFNDDNRIDAPDEATISLMNSISISCWLKDSFKNDSNNIVFGIGGGLYEISASVPMSDGRTVEWRAGNDSNDVLRWDMFLDDINPRTLSDWHHWVFVKDETAGEINMYFDGELVDSNDSVDTTLIRLRESELSIGAASGNPDDMIGSVDDFRLYDIALDADQVTSLFRGGELELAWAPEPRSGASDVDPNVVLSWEPGDYALEHDVYIGNTYAEVADANTTDTSGIYIDRFADVPDNNYPLPDPLPLGSIRYWRIDEVNEFDVNSPWKGKVWKFTVANYLVIDDFESYTYPPDILWHTWENPDWTGSYPELGRDPYDRVHFGTQSMKYIYNNDYYGVYYSEIERNYDSAQNWEYGGVKMLTIFFYGLPGNDANEQMYVGLADSDSDYFIDYDGDMNDIKLSEWQEWNIPLSGFTGVTLTDVRTVYIGFGDPYAVSAGGSGTVYMDDIRLYPPKCVPNRGPAYDFSGDCVVGYAEIAMMGDEWLLSDQMVPVSEPLTPPVGHWEMDEGDFNTVSDSSGNNYHGTTEGSFSWITGKIGSWAIDFTGGKVVVSDDGNTPLLNPASEVSVTAWVNYSQAPGYSARVIVKGIDTGDGESYGLELNEDDEPSFLVRDSSHGNHGLSSGETLAHDEWTHIAGVYDGTDIKVYVNGFLAASDGSASGMLLLQDTNDLAIGDAVDVDRAFPGAVDDARVYDYGLTDAEVAYIGTETTGYVPMPPTTMNLVNDEPDGEKAVNFRDYAELMLYWLDEQLWPL